MEFLLIYLNLSTSSYSHTFIYSTTFQNLFSDFLKLHNFSIQLNDHPSEILKLIKFTSKSKENQISYFVRQITKLIDLTFPSTFQTYLYQYFLY